MTLVHMLASSAPYDPAYQEAAVIHWEITRTYGAWSTDALARGFTSHVSARQASTTRPTHHFPLIR